MAVDRQLDNPIINDGVRQGQAGTDDIGGAAQKGQRPTVTDLHGGLRTSTRTPREAAVAPVPPAPRQLKITGQWER